MPCCGTPSAIQGVDEKNRAYAQYPPQSPINQQPGAQPGLGWQEKQYQAPAIPSPPPTHFSPGPPQSPPPSSFNHSYQQSTFNPSTLSGTTYQAPSIVRPAPSLPPSPPPVGGYGPVSTVSPPPLKKGYTVPTDEGKLSVSIDFGTTFSGIAYGSSRIAAGQVQQILHWPGSFETFRKIPTCLLYSDDGQVLAWGLEAKNASPVPGTIKCEWFKLFLEPKALRDAGAVDPRLPALPPGKKAIDLIVDFLNCIWEYAKQQITREIGAVADLGAADVWLTVPAAWDAMGCQMMREAAIAAQLVQSSRAGDRDWRDRLRIITEPEAAAVHCAHLTDLHRLQPNQNFMICDAGGGTVDLAIYKIIGQTSNLEIAEMCARSGANCGSLFLDLRFKELVRTLLADHPAHLDPPSLAYFMHNFSETDKLAYMGEVDDDKMFHFTCFNVEDPDDPAVGLINGELAIPGNLLRREVFEPVVNQAIELIEEQSKKVDQRLDAMLLVGGFSGSEYFFGRVKERFGSRIQVIARPSDCDTATVRGAAQYGLARRPLVSSVIAPQSYMMKVKLPAESDDWMKRPAYIKENDAGIPVCENRLQYLVAKGAVLRKGQRLKRKFCKFSQTGQDRIFDAIIYTSKSDTIMRYSDEGEITELCKWTVDLGSLPSFQENSNMPHPNGFYTEFELGLELDSAEVRGILIYEGQDWGHVVFDFRA